MSKSDLCSVIVCVSVGVIYPGSLTLMVRDISLETAWGPLCVLGLFSYAWLILASRELLGDLRGRWIVLAAGVGCVLTWAMFVRAAHEAEKG